jgi:hypothetical protein
MVDTYYNYVYIPPTRTGAAWRVMARSPYVEGLCPSSGDINRLMMMMT